MNDRSLKGLIEFLEWTGEKGLMAKGTVTGRKVAVSNVLGVLDPEEQGDITALDLDSVMTRFVNLQGKKYNTSSLNVYKSRTNAALQDFKQYLNDPLSFKPSTNKSEKQNGKASKAKTQKPQSTTAEPASPSHVGQTSSANVFPIQIRENLVIRVHGLPFDLTKSEAERIANVVKAMAME
jgi:hypothetical protein